jgi:hypothetical protein
LLEKDFEKISLAPLGRKLRIIPYKLHIYEKGGGFFEFHRDTLHSRNHFATGIFVFPTYHVGGDLVVKGNYGKEARFRSSNLTSSGGVASFFTGFLCLPVKSLTEESSRGEDKAQVWFVCLLVWLFLE